MRKKVLFSMIGCFLGSLVNSSAQSLPVGMSVLEDVHRREQLMGKSDSLISFTVRPLYTGVHEVDKGLATDVIDTSESFIKFRSAIVLPNNKFSAELLPVSWNQQYNTKIPYGWNDGAMIQAAGFQTYFTVGIYAKFGLVSLQLKPELISAENKEFEGLPTDQHDVIWAKYYDGYFNVSDIPERFGDKPYTKLFWGQSSLRLNFEPVSVGISSENLYWGPGMKGSLIMSNNAPGFNHITINTTKPVQTPIGSFEAQMVVGKLQNSGFSPPEINRVYEGRTLYIPKDDDSRYLSGFVLTYNPKVIPGLFIGAARVSQVYSKDAGGRVGDFLPILQPFEKKNDSEQRDYLSSLFFRWLWKEEMAEIYGEYGHNAPRNLRSLIYEPDLADAYLLGMRKLVPLNKRSDQFLQVGIELIELQQTSVPALGGWYTSNKIRHGYTNHGQILGAGIGPGSNLQSLNLSWIKGIKQIGFQLERYLHNNDLYYQIFAGAQDPTKHWIDMSYSLMGRWNYKNLIISTDISMIRSMNYQYVLYPYHPTEIFIPGLDFLNYQIKLGLTYRF